jgi:hypothetical protein
MTLHAIALSAPEMDSDILPTSPCAAHDSSASNLSSARRSDVIAETRSVQNAVVIQAANAWSQILATLSQCSSASVTLRETPDISIGLRTLCVHRRATGPNCGPSSTITVIEKLSNTLVSLSWHDPTLCNYEEQIWVCRQARTPGRCALSGNAIRRGDSIYRPRYRGYMPLNASEMILASELARLQRTNSQQRSQTVEAVNG